MLTAIVISVGVVGWSTNRLDGVQNRWEDTLQPGVGADDNGAVVVVAFDRQTIAALGTGWPVERAVHAELLRAIGQGSPRVIGYDVLFSEGRSGDDALAAALEATPTVIASALTLRAGAGPSLAIDEVTPTPQLAAAATAVGHANVTLAADTGVVRSMPVYAVDPRGVVIPSLALATVAIAEGSSALPIERPDGVQIGNRRVPANDGDLAINWSADLAAGTELSAIDVLRGAIDPSIFRDRIVLVGVTESTLGDQHLVPVDRSGSTSGIFVVANAVNTIVNDGYLSRPSGRSELAMIIGLAVLVALAFARWRLSRATAVAVLGLVAMVLFETRRFHVAGERWNVVWPVVTVALVAVALSSWRYLAEIRHRNRAWSLFATYVPSSVVDDLADPARLDAASASKRSTVSVLFCDLRGFTPIAASLDPDDVRRLLDHYYEYAVAIVHASGGTVMQFVGDEVFAVFGAPVTTSGDATAAVMCATELQDRIDELDDALIAGALPVLRFGIGVHRGLVTTAHVGTHDRRQYSAMGTAVNVGSRLCGQALAGEVVASGAALEDASAEATTTYEARETVTLKGIDHPLDVVRRPPHAPRLLHIPTVAS